MLERQSTVYGVLLIYTWNIQWNRCRRGMLFLPVYSLLPLYIHILFYYQNGVLCLKQQNFLIQAELKSMDLTIY